MPIPSAESETSVAEEKVQPLTRIVYLSPIIDFASKTYRALIGFRRVHTSFNEAVTFYSQASLRRFLNAPEQFTPSNSVYLVAPRAAQYLIDVYGQEELLKPFLSTVDKRTGKNRVRNSCVGSKQ